MNAPEAVVSFLEFVNEDGKLVENCNLISVRRGRDVWAFELSCGAKEEIVAGGDLADGVEVYEREEIIKVVGNFLVAMELMNSPEEVEYLE